MQELRTKSLTSQLQNVLPCPNVFEHIHNFRKLQSELWTLNFVFRPEVSREWQNREFCNYLKHPNLETLFAMPETSLVFMQQLRGKSLNVFSCRLLESSHTKKSSFFWDLSKYFLTQIHEKNPGKRSDLGFLEFQVKGIQDVTAVEGRKSGL